MWMVLWLFVGLIILYWFACLFQQTGGTIINDKVNKVVASKYRYQGEQVTRQEIVKIFLLAWGIRIGIYVISVVATMIFTEGTTFVFSDFLESWNRWDAPNYIDIAQYGYSHKIEDGQHLFIVFFPLYPWLLRIVHVVIRNWELASLFLSSLCYAGGACFFYSVLSAEYNKSIAYRTLVLISVFPFAFFFGGIMTESVFFLVMSMGFYFIQKKMWWAVGLVGILCSLARVQGVLLLGVAGVAFFVEYKPILMFQQKQGKEFLKLIMTKGIFLLLIPIGNIIYLLINKQVEGDYFAFSTYQSNHWGHRTTLFTNCLQEIWNNATLATNTRMIKMSIFIPELILFVLTMGFLVYGIKRHPLKYTAYLFVYTMINYSVTWLISGGRYMLCAFPLFIIGGELLERHPKAYPWVVGGSSILMGIYMTGYITWKQIM